MVLYNIYRSRKTTSLVSFDDCWYEEASVITQHNVVLTLQ